VTEAAVDDPRLWRLLAGEILRRLRRRARIGVLHPLRFAGSTPERILAAPPDIRPADADVARQFYAGRYPFAGRVIEIAGSPFSAGAGNAAFQADLHGFSWLRHFRAAGSDLAASNARALTQEWMRQAAGTLDGIAWSPEVVATRIVSWLRHSSILVQGSELSFYRAFLRSLALQVRYLNAVAPDVAPGRARLTVRIALAFAALSLPASPARLAKASRELAREIELQVLADGGHVSRNPEAILDLLADLLPLRQTYATQAELPPSALVSAIDRMFPALRFFLHRDGSLARFNGTGPTDRRLLAAILRHDEAGGAILRAAPHSGYQRLGAGATTLVCDTGEPPPPTHAGQAHAGTLSFEFSAGDNMFVVNAGVALHAPDEWRPLSRASAAHSTAVLADESSARFSPSPRTAELLGEPLFAGPRKVTVQRRDEAGAQSFRASHDGYVRRFGVVYERTLALNDDGSEIAAVDRFATAAGRSAQPGALRFHLHPDIAAARDADGRIVLDASGGERWAFLIDGPQPTVEESIFFADAAGPRKALQIVVDFDTVANAEIAWRFVRLAPVTSTA
jgi:uncharacterized heparinase superfamily protein